jgi:hypothetical protein
MEGILSRVMPKASVTKIRNRRMKQPSKESGKEHFICGNSGKGANSSE